MPINDLIDRLIEECRGDVHGALQALLLINERLEAELQYFYEQSNIDPPHRGTLHQPSINAKTFRVPSSDSGAPYPSVLKDPQLAKGNANALCASPNATTKDALAGR
jgi:hypothetical protein